MRIIYDNRQELFIVGFEDSEMVTWINTKDIVVAREEFIKRITRLFNDTVCKALKDESPEASMNNWIKLYEQVPPLDKDVELKVIVDGEERIYINKLIPMMSGKYIWAYCDYDGDEVIGWRNLK